MKKPEDEINTSYDEVLYLFKSLILETPFNVVLDLIEIMANERLHGEALVNRIHFVSLISDLFEQYSAAYQLDVERYPYKFFPRSSKEQGEATKQAIKTVRDSGMEGAVTHLRRAAEHINARQFAGSVADSINAVESVARLIDPKASGTLGAALNSLEKAELLKHKALKDGFQKIYGYTKDEQGISHALLEKGSPDVGLDEAMFMFGACASFAAYLVSKHRQAEQQQGSDQ